MNFQGKILYEHSPIEETATEECNLYTCSEIDESNNINLNRKSTKQKLLNNINIQSEHTKKGLEIENLNRKLQNTIELASKNKENSGKKISDSSHLDYYSSEVKELNKLMKQAKEACSRKDSLNVVELRKLSEHNTLKKSLEFANEENYKLRKIIEQSNQEETNNSLIYKYFSVFEDKPTKSPLEKFEKRFLIKNDIDQRKINLEKQKEERLDNAFNKELDYSKIIKENVNNLKSNFYKKSNKICGNENKKFYSFYGQIRNITNGFSGKANFHDIPDYNNDYSEKNNNYNINNNCNQTSRNKINLFNKSNVSNKMNFPSMININALSSYYANNESTSEINSPVTKKNYFSPSFLNLKKNTSVNNANANKNKKILKNSLNENTNMFEESQSKINASHSFNLFDDKIKCNPMKNDYSGFNNHYEVGSQYGKKNRDLLIPIINKKELYSSPRKDKYSLK